MYKFQIILWFISLNSLCASKTEEEVRKLLTRNDTKTWLKSMETTNNGSPYCKLCCVNITMKTIGKECGSHTLCKYPPNEIGPSCRGYVNVMFTKDEQSAILDVHNTLRNKVATGSESRGKPGPQPSASNMRVLMWNDELAQIAERWGSQCIFGHDRCRDTVLYPVGQNLISGNLATNNELSLVEEWYEEVTMFNKEEVASFKMPENGDHLAGQYTQLIWADTYQIGCARAIFQEAKEANITYKEHLICNYGPAGNIPNQAVYKSGKPCTSCPQGTTCSVTYSGLCEIQQKFDKFAHKLFMKSSSNLETVSFALVSIYVCNILVCLFIFK